MPQQPAPPVVIEPPAQEIPAPVYYPTAGETDVTNKNESDSNSISNAENVVTNAASLSAYQINSNHEATYFSYKNRTQIPGTSIYGDYSVINDRYGGTRHVGQIGFRHTFGGRAKREALRSVRLENLNDTLTICQKAGYFRGDFEIDFRMIPELADCAAIRQKTIAQRPSEITVLKQQLLEQKKLIQEMRKTNEALQLRLIQMQHEAPVRVGG